MIVWLRLPILIICLGLFTGCTITIGDGLNITTEKQEESDSNDLNEVEANTDDESKVNKQKEKDNEEKNSDEETNDTQVIVSEREESREPESSEDKIKEETEKDDIVIQNDAIQVFEPLPNAKVKNEINVRGLARVFEGTVQYSFEDGHHVYDQGFTTAMNINQGWGEFNITIDLDDVVKGEYRVVLFELSAKDDSILHELIIPVQVVK